MPVGTIPPTVTASATITDPSEPTVGASAGQEWVYIDLSRLLPAPTVADSGVREPDGGDDQQQVEVTLKPVLATTQPESTPTPMAVAAEYAPPPHVGALSQSEFRAVLDSAGWPAERQAEAYRVACGAPPHWPSGESGCNPSASNGPYDGLFALGNPFWFDYCGTDGSQWADPYVNAVTALCVGNYDLATGQDFWAQWEVKPY